MKRKKGKKMLQVQGGYGSTRSASDYILRHLLSTILVVLSSFKKLQISSLLGGYPRYIWWRRHATRGSWNASIQFFKMIHSISEKLSQIMKRRCDKMIRKDCSKIHLSILPPSPTPTYYHRICVYHQMKVWKILCDTDWSLYRGVEILVMTPLSL